jgi:membrane fusion protein, multidrug efflux system
MVQETASLEGRGVTQEPAGQEPSRRSRTGLVLTVLAVVLIAVVLVRLFSRKAPKGGAAPQVVEVAQAVKGNMAETLTELGTVSPVATVTVLPQLSGYLTEVGYREGEDVTKGQFLAQIDPRQYQIDLQQALAQLLKDHAVLAQARSDLARYERLHARKAIAEQTVTDQQFLVVQDEAQVKTDEANVAQYRLDLVYCHITAPVSGRVGLRLVDPGNYVTASSSPGIVVITTIKPTTVQFAVAQNDLGEVIDRFDSGAKLPVTVYSSDNARKIATGTLYAIGNQMATSTGTVTLRASFANRDEALFPNEFVNVKLLVNTLSAVVLVPTPAVLSGAPGNYVYLVNANDTVSVRKVTPGPSDGVNTAILAGLAVGDRVVTEGTDRLSEGAKISIAAANSASGAAVSAAPSQRPQKPKKTSGTQTPGAGTAETG